MNRTIRSLASPPFFSPTLHSIVSASMPGPPSYSTHTEKPFNRLSNLELNISAIKIGWLVCGWTPGERRESIPECCRRCDGTEIGAKYLQIKCSHNLSNNPRRQFPLCAVEILKPLEMFLPTDATLLPGWQSVGKKNGTETDVSKKEMVSQTHIHIVCMDAFNGSTDDGQCHAGVHRFRMAKTVMEQKVNVNLVRWTWTGQVRNENRMVGGGASGPMARREAILGQAATGFGYW